MNTPAWRALSMGARELYTWLKWNYNTKHQNAVYLSTRDAAKKMGCRRNNVLRWFKELEFYGFIKMVSAGALGVDGRGKAPHYRLTEEPYEGAPPTRDFQQWNGDKVQEQKPARTYLERRKREFIQNPGSYGEARVVRMVKPVREINRTRVRQSGSGGEAIQTTRTGSYGEAISIFTTPCPCPSPPGRHLHIAPSFKAC